MLRFRHSSNCKLIVVELSLIRIYSDDREEGEIEESEENKDESANGSSSDVECLGSEDEMFFTDTKPVEEDNNEALVQGTIGYVFFKVYTFLPLYN